MPFRYTKMGRWTGKTTIRDKNAESGLRIAETEIDLLGIGEHEEKYLVGECQFKNSPFSYSEYLYTITKLTPLKNRATFYYALFSLSGFDEKITEEANSFTNIRLYNFDEIINHQ